MAGKASKLRLPTLDRRNRRRGGEVGILSGHEWDTSLIWGVSEIMLNDLRMINTLDIPLQVPRIMKAGREVLRI